MKLTAVVVIVSLLVPRRAWGWGTGAPYKTCIDSYPKHDHGHIVPQTTRAPYSISLNTSAYSPGDIIRVTLAGSNGTLFRGFQVRAHKGTGDKEDIIGNFVVAPDNARLQFWYPRESGDHNCVTHRDASDKEEIILLWQAPSKSVGDLIFRCGFVKDYNTFWPDVRSSVLKAALPAQVIETDESVTSAMPPLSLYTECGVSKGCLLYPATCSGDSCRYGLTYVLSNDGGHFVFELFGNVGSNEYLAVGFSHDKLMGHDTMLSCYMNEDLSAIGFTHGYCPKTYCDRIPIDNVTDLSIKRDEGRLICRFMRPVQMTHHVYKQNYKTGELLNVSPITFDLAKKWHIFLAWGKLSGGMDVLGKHDQLPIVSHNKIDLKSMTISHGRQLPIELQLHAALGLLSWLGVVGLGMFTARHHRDINKPCLGLPAWLQMHRAGMIFAVLCSSAGIVIIFVYLREWTEHATIHAVIGLVAVGLSLLQTLFGLCRPDINSSFRPLFNWAHRLSAIVCFVSAAVCLLLGAQNILLHQTLRQIETIIIAVGLFFQVFWEAILEFQNIKQGFSSDGHDDKAKKADSFELEDVKDDPRFNLKTFVFWCFIITSLVTVVLSIIFVVELI